MADGKVLVSSEVGQKGKSISLIQKDTDKLTKSTDKAAASNKRQGKSQETVIKGQKGIHQGNLSSAKSFSKMNQMLGSGGSSGLVAAYATLAANVFAASAAFLALSNAAQFSQLQRGLEELGAQSGRTLSVVAQGLRDVTGGALSAQQAMTGAALGFSGGFGASELEGLAKIARGASITLGRDLGDAFDRLTRGAIKLEPEILDELGIMVRLDDAVENYAAQLGKAAGAMSQAERRQAFMNAILEQGEAKFGAIAEKVEPTAYAKLGATFADLTKNIFTFVNEGLKLEVFVSFLAENMIILAGVMTIFGSTIVNTMLPGLANAASGAANFAEQTALSAEALETSADAAVKAGRTQIGAFKGGSKGFKDFQSQIVKGTKDTKVHTSAIGRLNKGVTALRSNQKGLTGQMLADNKLKIKAYQSEIAMIEQQIILEQAKGKAAQASAVANIKADSASVISDTTTLFTAGALSFGGAATSIFSNMKDEIDKTGKAAKAAGSKLGIFTRSKIASSAAGTAFIGILRIIGATLLSFALPIGIAIALLGTLFFAYNKIFNTKEVKAFKKGQEELGTILESLNKKAEVYQETIERAGPVANAQITQFSIISGILDEVNNKLKEQIKLRKAANESRPGEMSEGLSANDSMLAINNAFSKGSKGNQNEIIAEGLGLTEKQLLSFINPEGIATTISATMGAMGGTSSLNAEGQEALDSMKKGLASMFQIKDTAEFKSFMGILGGDVPVLAELLTRKLDITKIVAEGGKITKEKLATAIATANEQTKLLGASAQSVNEQLKAGEKQAGSFLRSLSPKTGADAIIKVVDSIIKEVDTLQESVAKTFNISPDDMDSSVKVLVETGKALSATGGQMASLMGIKFQKDLDKVKAAEKSINDTKKEGGKVSDKQLADLDTALHTLGGHEESYKKTSKTLKIIQRQTIERKIEMKAISGILKGMNKLEKASIDASEIRFKTTKADLASQKELNDAYRKMIKGTFSKMTDGEGFVAMFKDGETSLETLLDLANKEAVSAENVFTFRKLINEELLIAAQILINTQTKDHQITVAKAKAQEEEVRREKELFDMKQKGLILEAQINSFKKGDRTGGTDPAKTLALEIKAAKEAARVSSENLERRKTVIDAETAINKAELIMLEARMKLAGIELSAADKTLMETAFDNAGTAKKNVLGAEDSNLQKQVTASILKGFANAGAEAESGDYFSAYTTALKAATEEGGLGADGGVAASTAERFALAQTMMEGFANSMEELGPEGAKNAAFIQGMSAMTSMVQVFGTEGVTAAEKVKAISGTLAAVGSAIMASSKAQSAEIQNQIDMEEKRDGKSKKSLEKIKALKAKQTAIERKAFEQNKKIQLASAVINGMAAIQSGFATQPFFPLGLAMGTMAVAMTAMQIKSIKAQTFQGGDTSSPASPSSISVGKRDNKVDTSRGATGGELAYLRGNSGIGSNANSFRSGAAGMKSYASGGEILVGERGPELISPLAPMEVTPNDKMGGTSNVNFTINAVDAAGVQELLQAQRGNIIGMIREAAHEHGEEFMDSVNTEVYN